MTIAIGTGYAMSVEAASREHRLTDTFISLADTLVRGFDVAALFDDLAAACVELLGVSAAGLMLLDPAGRLRVMASSSERSRLLELLEIQTDEGPCLDCHRTGAAVLVGDLTAEQERWPVFAAETLRVGFGAVYALPMRLREETIGALNLFGRDMHSLTPDRQRLGQALADMATIGILQQRAVQRSAELAEHLQTALNTRVIIEQAKGVVSGREELTMQAAFDRLRTHARTTGTRLSDIALAVVTGELDPADLNVRRPKHAGTDT